MLKKNTGKFPVNMDKDKSKRFTPPANPKGYSSFAPSTGDFPVKTSKGSEKRFNPPAP